MFGQLQDVITFVVTLIKLDFDLFLGMTSATLECWGGYYCPGS